LSGRRLRQRQKDFAFEVTYVQGKIKLNAENELYGWFGQVPLNSVYNYGKCLRKIV
jgi:hypothetical protein